MRWTRGDLRRTRRGTGFGPPAALLLAGVSLAAGAGQAADVESGVREALLQKGEGEYFVYLGAHADLSAATALEDWGARGRGVYDALTSTARQSQAGVLALLQQESAVGNVESFHPFFIVDAIHVRSNVAALDALAAHPDVVTIEAPRHYEIPRPERDAAEAEEWGVLRIRAPEVWAEGVTGEGIVVANIDTGVDFDHPAVVDQYRGFLDPGFDHDFNFYDPSNICPGDIPCDNDDHGTHTMGTMLGDDGGNNQIGVAPGARWIASKGCETNSCSQFALMSSAEWILAPCPTGVSPGAPTCDPEMRPHVVNNSWGGGGGNPWYQAMVQAWRAAGIFPAFSAGNSGPFSGSVGSPGDYAESFASGATDINDVIASFSSRGPSRLTNETKPDVSAPGVSVRSSVSGGGYANFNGTSMASPHTAGCVALLMSSVQGAITLEEIEDLLRDTAVDLGTGGPDSTYGFGRIDCFEAFSDLEPTFTLASAPEEQTVCAPNLGFFAVDVGVTQDFSSPVFLSATGSGPGLPFAFMYPAVVAPPATTYLWAWPTDAGEFDLEISGQSGPILKSTAVKLRAVDSVPGASTLVAPGNLATSQPIEPTFEWTAVPGTDEYFLLVVGAQGDVRWTLTTETRHTFEAPLDPETVHAWTVVGTNACGNGAVAVPAYFSTGKVVCSEPNLVIGDLGTVSDTIVVSGSAGALVGDVDVVVEAEHTYVGDLTITLDHALRSATLMARPPCASDDIAAEFDDEGSDGPADSMCGSPVAISGNPTPTTPLSAFDGSSVDGLWTLSVSDDASFDTGVLRRWCLMP